MISRRTALALGAALLAGRQAAAQAWPTRPIRMIVPFGLGGSADVAARFLAEPLQQALGQPVRKDDDPEVFKTRLAAYNRDTAVVAPYYAEQGRLKQIDGMQPVDVVTTAIMAAVGE